MPPTWVIVATLAAWGLLTPPVALLIGKSIKRADRQEQLTPPLDFHPRPVTPTTSATPSGSILRYERRS